MSKLEGTARHWSLRSLGQSCCPFTTCLAHISGLTGSSPSCCMWARSDSLRWHTGALFLITEVTAPALLTMVIETWAYNNVIWKSLYIICLGCACSVFLRLHKSCPVEEQELCHFWLQNHSEITVMTCFPRRYRVLSICRVPFKYRKKSYCFEEFTSEDRGLTNAVNTFCVWCILHQIN